MGTGMGTGIGTGIGTGLGAAGADVVFAGVSFSYGGPSVLEAVDLVIAAGEFLGIVGPNGGGKSTLLKLMLGLLTPTAGRVTVFGQPPKAGRTRIGYCPQHPSFARDFPISVRDAVLLGRLGRSRAWGGYTAQDHAVATAALESTELLPVAGRQIGTLSGGQLQRVLIARALAAEPDLLILDEPTANIDQRVEGDIFELLKELNRRITVCVVSHDVGFVSGYVTRVACLNRTLVCHTTATLTGRAIADLYHAPVSMVDHHHHT